MESGYRQLIRHRVNEERVLQESDRRQKEVYLTYEERELHFGSYREACLFGDSVHLSRK